MLLFFTNSGLMVFHVTLSVSVFFSVKRFWLALTAESSHEYIINVGVQQGCTFWPMLSAPYLSDDNIFKTEKYVNDNEGNGFSCGTAQEHLSLTTNHYLKSWLFLVSMLMVFFEENSLIWFLVDCFPCLVVVINLLQTGQRT